ncbi:hypothetical protein INS49_007120 [Diaporthe citri]|uniref:uncharacterized protein n=1 Tax=Diaporthe citri TaxID=83186 RepID=UPI001C803070|nr:uncharacterized protein INS49_007120 [Diaporthe citri]KAG6365509.1 hypothetical protein INS49_007120 [Diaporthe citri]
MTSSNNEQQAPNAKIPSPTYLFSASVSLGQTVGPIPLLEGGTRYVEPIVGGTISGPSFTGTIDGGFAAPIHIGNTHDSNEAKAKLTFVYAYGHASDGSPFYMEESGVGLTEIQNTRLKLMVGGQYEDLQKTYILAQPSLSADRPMATVDCYSIPLPT